MKTTLQQTTRRFTHAPQTFCSWAGHGFRSADHCFKAISAGKHCTHTHTLLQRSPNSIPFNLILIVIQKARSLPPPIKSHWFHSKENILIKRAKIIYLTVHVKFIAYNTSHLPSYLVSNPCQLNSPACLPQSTLHLPNHAAALLQSFSL